MSETDGEGATQRMAHADARQWQRFGYPADIQLSYEPAGPSPARQLAAVSFDLGLGGMQLRAAAGLAVGTRVTCQLPQLHGSLQLPGRVRWCRADGASQLRFRMGVAFDELRASAHQNLQAIVSQVERAGEMVRVHLPSWSEPLLAITEPSEHGVRLRLPLPLLSGGSVVRFEPLQTDHALEGRLLGSQLRETPGSQSVELDLLLSPCEPARKRRYLVYDDAQPTAALALRPRERQPTEHTSLSVPKTRLNGLLLQGAIVTALFWLGFGVTRYFTPVRVPSLRSNAPQARETSVQAASALATSAPEPVPGIEPQAALPPPPAAPSGSALTETLPAATEPQHEPQAPGPLEPTARAATAPALSTTSDTTELFVPVSGPTLGLSIAQWVDPAAVVVTLPTGRLELTKARYDLDAAGVSSLRVGAQHGVTQLRVYLTTVLSRFEVVPARGGIVIRLKRDLQSPPR